MGGGMGGGGMMLGGGLLGGEYHSQLISREMY
jgi:hypothetical protein